MLAVLLLVSVVALLQPGGVDSCSVASLEGSLDDLVRSVFATTGQQGSTVSALTITQFQVVCLTTGTTRGTYSSVSVIVLVDCTGTACPTETLQQFEFDCENMGAWTSPSNIFGVPSGANLTTSLRTDCGQCARTVAAQFMSRFDTATHCVACSSLCNTGLMECTGLGDADCCNGVENNMCVSNCTAPGRPLASVNYTCTEYCDPLTAPLNGSITQSSGILIDSVATYSCDVNYEIQGSANRTCQVSVSATDWSGDAPSCIRDTAMVTDATTVPTVGGSCDLLMAGTNQVIMYAVGCMVEVDCIATYSCEDKYELKDGDISRTCTQTKDGTLWSGTAPKCEQIQKNNRLSTGVIVGIVIAALAVLAVVVSLPIIIGILLVKYKKRDQGKTLPRP